MFQHSCQEWIMTRVDPSHSNSIRTHTHQLHNVHFERSQISIIVDLAEYNWKKSHRLSLQRDTFD